MKANETHYHQRKRGLGPPRLIFPLMAALACLSTSCGEPSQFDADETRSALMSPVTRVCVEGPTTFGIDVSYHQGVFDWNNAVNQGVQWAVVRISDGDFLDPQFDTNWSQLKRLNMIRGAYQYIHTGFDIELQAQIVIDAVGRLGPGDLPVVLDHEDPDRHPDGFNAEVLALKRWITLVEEGTGKRPIIYTRGWYFQPLTGTAAYQEDKAFWEGLDFWIANYDVECPWTPTDPAPTWWAWQYSETGQLPGHIGNLDFNNFNGTYEELRRYAGGDGLFIGPPAPTPPSDLDCGGKGDGWYVSDDTHNSVSLCCNNQVDRTRDCQPHDAIRNFDGRHDFCLEDDGQGYFDCEGNVIPRSTIIPKDPASTCEEDHFVPSSTGDKEEPFCGYGCYSGHVGNDFSVGNSNCNTVGVYAPVDCEVLSVVNDQPDRSEDFADEVDCRWSTSRCKTGDDPYGNHIICQEMGTDKTIKHRLAHMAHGSVEVVVGDELSAGEYVGIMSDSGTTATDSPPRACHVHHDILVDGNYVNPQTCSNGLPASGLYRGDDPTSPGGAHAAPTFTSPGEGVVLPTRTAVEFCWSHPSEVPEASRLMITSSRSFAESVARGDKDPRNVCTDCVFNDTTGATCIEVPAANFDGEEGAFLYALVRGGSTGRGGLWSQVRTFSLEANTPTPFPYCTAPEKITPLDNDVVDRSSDFVTLRWNAATCSPRPSPHSYDLVLTHDERQANNVFSGAEDPDNLLGCIGCVYHQVRPFTRKDVSLDEFVRNPTYWLVRARGADGEKGAWSPPTSFRVGTVQDPCDGVNCPSCTSCMGGSCVADANQNGDACGNNGICSSSGICEEPTCPNNLDGDYCQGGDLYTCTNGTYTLKELCGAAGCTVMPAGMHDECAPPVDPCDGVTCPSCTSCMGGSCVADMDGSICDNNGTCAAGICEAPVQCSAGACCNVAAGTYYPSTHPCALGIDERYVCEAGEGSGSDISVQIRDQFCSGSSSFCNGSRVWSDSFDHQECDPGEGCQTGSSTCQPVCASGDNSCPAGCTSANDSDCPPPVQCSAGACCNVAAGTYYPSTHPCALGIDERYVCEAGEGSGSDISVQIRDQFCSGQSAQCTGARVWSGSFDHQECDPGEGCQPGSSTCQPVSVCQPGEVDEQSCTPPFSLPIYCNPGTQARTCDGSGQWGSWGNCEPLERFMADGVKSCGTGAVMCLEVDEWPVSGEFNVTLTKEDDSTFSNDINPTLIVDGQRINLGCQVGSAGQTAVNVGLPVSELGQIPFSNYVLVDVEVESPCGNGTAYSNTTSSAKIARCQP